jgi:hypothetical protein
MDILLHPGEGKPLILEAVVSIQFRMVFIICEKAEGGQTISNIDPNLLSQSRYVLSLPGQSVWGSKLEKASRISI